MAGIGKPHKIKKLFSRRVRRAYKNKDLGNYSYYKKLNCPWDIADFHFHASWEDFQNWGWVKDSDMTEVEKRAYWKSHYGSK